MLPNYRNKKKITIQSKHEYIELLANELRKTCGPRNTKELALQVSVCERTARNWISAVRGPNGYELIKLMCYSERVNSLVLRIIENNKL